MRALGRTRSRQIVQGLVAIADQAANSLGNFLVTLLLARALHLEEFGVYSLLFAALMLANGLVNTLVSEPIRTLGVGNQGPSARHYVGSQLIAGALLGSPAGVLTALVLITAFHVAPVTAAVVGATVILSAVFEALRAIAAARARWHGMLVADCAAQGLKVLILGLALRAHSASVALAFGALSVSMLLGSATLLLGGIRAALPSAAYLVRQLRAHAAFGKWLTLESLVFILSTQVYLYLLALVVDVSTVGAYSAAQTMVNAVNLLWMGTTSYAVSTARGVLLQEGALAWRRWLLHTGGAVLGGVALILIAISFSAEPLLRALYTERYAHSAPLVPLLALAGFLMAGNSVLGAAFRTIDMPQMGFHGKWVSAIVTLLISVPLVRQWGAAGAAVGAIVTQLCWLGVYLWGLEHIQRDWVHRIDSLRLALGHRVAADSA